MEAEQRRNDPAKKGEGPDRRVWRSRREATRHVTRDVLGRLIRGGHILTHSGTRGRVLLDGSSLRKWLEGIPKREPDHIEASQAWSLSGVSQPTFPIAIDRNGLSFATVLDPSPRRLVNVISRSAVATPEGMSRHWVPRQAVEQWSQGLLPSSRSSGPATSPSQPVDVKWLATTNFRSLAWIGELRR